MKIRINDKDIINLDMEDISYERDNENNFGIKDLESTQEIECGDEDE